MGQLLLELLFATGFSRGYCNTFVPLKNDVFSYGDSGVLAILQLYCDQMYVRLGWIRLIYPSSEVAIQRCSYKKVLWKYAENLQENTHTEVRFQWSCFFQPPPRHGCSPLNLLYIFRTTFPKNTSGPLLVPLSIFCFLTF